MKNIQILKEIIEAVEKHSEFKVKNFDSNTTASENDEEIFFNIKFCLRKKENIDAVSEVPAAEVLPAGPGPKEENQSEEPVLGKELKANPADIALDEEVSEIQGPCCEEEESPKRKRKVEKEYKKCVDCVNCYNDDKVDELKCCKGNKKIISEHTRATFCDDYHAR